MTNLERWRFYLKDIESPEIYIDWGFHTLISAALQRRVWMHTDPLTGLPGSMSLFANLYAWLVGPPATGKGRVINQVMSIVKSPKLEVPDITNKIVPLLPYAPDACTLEAITQHMGENTKARSFKVLKNGDGKYSYFDVKHGEGDLRNYGYSPCCFLIEELEVLFKKQSHDMVAALCHCFDSHDLHYKTKTQGEDKLKNICVTMLAGTTPESIRDLVNEKVVKKGLSSRVIMVFASEPRFDRQFPGLSPQQQQAFVELLQYCKQLTNVVTEVRLSPEAAAWHKEMYESGHLRKKRINNSPYLDHYYGRKNTHGLKLAMINLYSEQMTSNIIELHHIQEAYKQLDTTEFRMHECFNSTTRNPVFETAMEIVRYLEHVPDGVKHNKVWWDFSRNLRKEEFDECMELLSRTNQAQIKDGIWTALAHKNGD